MGNLLDGLFLYEVILMLLGTVLFVALIVIILTKKEIHKNHLAGFGISIIMIAFPSIKSFSISDGMVNIERWTKEVEENPQDSVAQEKLKNEVAALEDRPINSIKGLVTLSEANWALGDETKAKAYAEHALEKESDNPQAKEVIKVLEINKDLKSVKSNPNDKEAKKSLEKDVESLERINTKSGRRTAKIAEIHAELGNYDKAREFIDSTKMYQPKNVDIRKIERRIPLKVKADSTVIVN